MKYYINELGEATEFYLVGDDFIYKLIISNDWSKEKGKYIDYADNIGTVSNLPAIERDDYFGVIDDLNIQFRIGSHPPHAPGH